MVEFGYKLGYAAIIILLIISPVFAGSVSYPAVGNVDLLEGTIELWLTPTADLYPPMNTSNYAVPMKLFHLKVPDGFNLSVGWNVKKNHGDEVSGLYASMTHLGPQGDGLMSIPTKSLDWEPGQTHHVVFTWRGRGISLYADGNLLAERSQRVGFTGKLANCELVVGDAEGRNAGFILHAVRISRIAHDVENDVKPVATLDTLLLDRFDGQSLSGTQTKAEVIAGLTGETGGTIKGARHPVQAPKPGLLLGKKQTP